MSFNLSQQSLDAIRSEASSRWLNATGNDPELAQHLAGIDFVIADLGGRTLAQYSSTTVRIDTTAAGNGWFVDTTLASDSEFLVSGAAGSRLANSDSNAYAKYDLLTVVMHEIGHAVGLAHVNQAGELMNRQLTAGRRAFISDQDVASVSLDAIQAGTVDGAELSDQEKIASGLNAFAAWADNLEQELSDKIEESFAIPFIDTGLKDLWDTTGGVITDGISDWHPPEHCRHV